MICFSLLWVGLIWITDVKIPQDVLKMISGHVVTEKWHVKNAVSTPILFQRIFLENPHNNKMSYKYLVEAWYSLEQYIGLKEDKLSSTTVDFIRSEGNLETKHLYWFSKPKMC